MYHTVEFTVGFVADLEIPRKHRLERVLLPKGTRRQAQIKPSVVEGVDGPVEVADLFFEDGTATPSVPFAFFAFVE